ncbi:MAG: WD40 repeat domain-containing protein [Cyanobacteria bacterium P01_G01_bin.54]
MTASPPRSTPPLDHNQQAIALLGRTLTLSADEFSLTLVRCNYQRLEQQTLQALRAWLAQQTPSRPIPGQPILGQSVPWQTVRLHSEATNLLSLLRQRHQQMPGAPLMVMNLEQTHHLAAVLEGINRDRDEFRKQLPVPVVLWLTDVGFTQLARLALDFKTWGAASIALELSLQGALTLWWETVEYLFETLLSVETDVFIPNSALDLAPDGRRRCELAALKKQVHLTPVNQATWQFIVGRDAYASGEFEAAIAHFQRSLSVWSRGQGDWQRHPLTFELPPAGKMTNPFVENKGLLLLHLGLCWARLAQQPGRPAQTSWQRAADNLAASWEIFTIKRHPALAAQVLLQLGQVLQYAQDWDSLARLSDLALTLPPIQQQPQAIAQVYGFRAQVALARQDYIACQALVQQALTQLQQPTPESQSQPWASILLTWAHCQAQQGDRVAALQTLEQIRQVLVEYWQTGSAHRLLTQEQVYGEVLMQLRQLYTQQGNYRAAFACKQVYYQILRSPVSSDREAAIAGPVSSLGDGRAQAVQDFLERLSRSDHKLTVLHGGCGVGKSQFLQMSLIPALQHTILAAREVIPVLQNRYRDWEPNLCQQFQQAMPGALNFPVTQSASLLAHLRQNGDAQKLTVLIWDQFEDFFVTCAQFEQRARFYRFFQQVLCLPFVKVILVVRDESLHTLLALEQQVNLESIDQNLLDRHIRYALKNFSLSEAQRALQGWRTQLAAPFEPELITTLVQDLADPEGRIRPLELQLLALQLQTTGITTLAQYRGLGPTPRRVLITQALDTIVADCGPENQRAAWQVLAALTHDRNQRLLKTEMELRQSLTLQQRQSPLDPDPPTAQLDLILTVLVGSELVMALSEGGEPRYQLSHDYLVPTIRQRYQQRTQAAIAAEFAQSEQRLHRARRQQRWAWRLGLVMALLAGGMALWSGQVRWQRRLAQQQQLGAELQAQSAAARVALGRGERLSALRQALRAGHQLRGQVTGAPRQFPLQTQLPIPSPVQLQVLATLEQSVHQVWERQRLVGHQETVWDATYTPDSGLIASVGHDRTVRLWSDQGEALATLEDAAESLTSVVLLDGATENRGGYTAIASSAAGQLYQWQIQKQGSQQGSLKRWQSSLTRQWSAHESAIYTIATSPDQAQLATASATGTIKLWSRDGKPLQTLRGHTDAVQWVTFSPDGQHLASVSSDETIRLWDVQTGALRQTLRPTGQDTEHEPDCRLLAIAFHPDGQMLAIAGDDGRVSLWDRQGQLLRSWSAHRAPIWSVQFSPDGQRLATGSDDRTIGLWTLQGEQQQTLHHRDRVTTVRFRADGQQLLSTSADKTLKLWQLGGQPRPQWQAHPDGPVWSVAFDPQGKRIATGGEDGLAHLWRVGAQNSQRAQRRRTFTGHQDAVRQVRFAPDGQHLATASADGRVGLWRRNGQHQHWLMGHKDAVVDVQWHPGGQVLASGGRDRTVRLWSVNARQLSGDRPPEPEQILRRHTHPINALVWSPDGDWLASAGDEKLLLWPYGQSHGQSHTQPQLGKPRTFRSAHPVVVALAFVARQGTVMMTPDDRWLATAHYDDTLQFWTAQGDVTQEMVALTDSPRAIRLSPDNELIATLSWDERLQLWQGQGDLIQEWASPQARLTSLAWRADGGAIATGGEDGTVVIWNLELETLMRRGCRWLEDYLQYYPRVRAGDRAMCEEYLEP